MTGTFSTGEWEKQMISDGPASEVHPVEAARVRFDPLHGLLVARRHVR